MPQPIQQDAAGIDLTPRFVRSTTVAASPADATETIICTLTVPGDIAQIAGIELVGWAAYTIGTNGVSGNLKIRRTNASGTTIVATGVCNEGTWAATQLTEQGVMGFDTGGTLPNQVYVLTLTVGSATAASTVSAAYLRALVV